MIVFRRHTTEFYADLACAILRSIVKLIETPRGGREQEQRSMTPGKSEKLISLMTGHDPRTVAKYLADQSSVRESTRVAITRALQELTAVKEPSHGRGDTQSS